MDPAIGKTFFSYIYLRFIYFHGKQQFKSIPLIVKLLVALRFRSVCHFNRLVNKYKINQIINLRFLCAIVHVSQLCNLVTYLEKLLDSDWLRAVQFKCNASAN